MAINLADVATHRRLPAEERRRQGPREHARVGRQAVGVDDHPAVLVLQGLQQDGALLQCRRPPVVAITVRHRPHRPRRPTTSSGGIGRPVAGPRRRLV